MEIEIFLNRLANLLIVTGLGLIGFIFYPVIQQEINFQSSKIASQEVEIIDNPEDGSKLAEQQRNNLVFQPSKIVPKSYQFGLVIPKIGVNSEVFPNIDSGNEEEYLPILKKGVAHALGSAMPYENGMVFIFAHSTDAFYNITRYNAVFYLLNKLTTGDDVYIFYKEKKYSYKVIDKKIISPAAVPNEVSQLTGRVLVLQTCWPPGTTLKRLLIIAGRT